MDDGLRWQTRRQQLLVAHALFLMALSSTEHWLPVMKGRPRPIAFPLCPNPQGNGCPLAQIRRGRMASTIPQLESPGRLLVLNRVLPPPLPKPNFGVPFLT